MLVILEKSITFKLFAHIFFYKKKTCVNIESNYCFKIPFSTKKNNGSKQHKRGSNISLSSGTYTKKTNPSCKDCPHRPPKSLTPSSSRSSSSSSINSSKGLLKNVPKQVKTNNKLKKILWRTTRMCAENTILLWTK